jgi:hypothetical protein
LSIHTFVPFGGQIGNPSVVVVDMLVIIPLVVTVGRVLCIAVVEVVRLVGIVGLVGVVGIVSVITLVVVSATQPQPFGNILTQVPFVVPFISQQFPLHPNVVW